MHKHIWSFYSTNKTKRRNLHSYNLNGRKVTQLSTKIANFLKKKDLIVSSDNSSVRIIKEKVVKRFVIVTELMSIDISEKRIFFLDVKSNLFIFLLSEPQYI